MKPNDTSPPGAALPAALSAALLLAAVVWDLFFDVEHGSSICPLRALTGVECPSCGLTRSFVALGNAEVGRAFAAHPLGPALALLLGLEVLRWGVAAARRRALSPSRPMQLAWVALGVSMLVFGVARWLS